MGESARQKKRPQREGGKAGAVPDQSAPRRWAHPIIPTVFCRQWFQGPVLGLFRSLVAQFRKTQWLVLETGHNIWFSREVSMKWIIPILAMLVLASTFSVAPVPLVST